MRLLPLTRRLEATPNRKEKVLSAKSEANIPSSLTNTKGKEG